MEWVDVSVFTAPFVTPLYPGTPPVQYRSLLSLDRGDHATDTFLEFGIHSGTHLDYPSHFIRGAKSSSDIRPETLIGSADIIDCRGEKIITEAVLKRKNIKTDVERLLFKTDNSKLWNRPDFQTDYVGIDLEAARFLTSLKDLKLVGIDYLSIQPFGASTQIHIELLKHEVLVLEGLNLENVESGRYELLCLPLKLKDTEGAPARALVRKMKD